MMLTERKTKLRLDIGINHLFQANTHFCTNSFGGGKCAYYSDSEENTDATLLSMH